MQTKTKPIFAQSQAAAHIPAPLIRKRVTFIVLLLLIIAGPFGVCAQCTINSGNTTSGFTPAEPDTITQGIAYSQTEQLYVPATYETVTIDSIRITNITGQPAGITYVINPVSGSVRGGSNGAICFSGTTSAAAGSYPLTFTGNAYAHGLGTVPVGNLFSLTLTVQAPPDTTTYPYGTHCDSTRSISVQMQTFNQQIPCSGGTQLTAQISGNTTGADYSWNTGDNSFEVSATAAGLYVVTVTNAVGCSSSASINITNSSGINNTVNFSLPDSPVCGGNLFTFNNLSTDTSGYSSDWFIDGNGPSTQTNLRWTLYQGTHSIQLIMDSAGCKFFYTQNFIVQFPGIQNFDVVLSDGNRSYICQGLGSDTLSADSTYSHYVWSTGSTAADIIVHHSGNYSVTVTDSNGCTAYGERNVYNVDSLLCSINTTSSAISKCEGTAHILEAVSYNYGFNIASYVWSDGTNGSSDSVAPLTTSTYFVTITDTYGCTAKADTTITVMPNPRPVVNPGANQTLPACGTDTLGSNPTATGGTMPYVYHWSPYNGISSISSPNPTVNNIYASTTYMLVVTDSVGCTDTGHVTITPILTAPITPPVVTENSCELSFPQDSGYTTQWYHNGYPVTGATAPSYAEDSSGSWNAIITSTVYPLCHVSSNYINIYPYSGQQICIVTLDSTATYNMVVWDNTAGEGISKFRIYKQSDSTSQFVLLGEQAASQFSTYTDSTSNPSQYSASYEISIVDSCGNESYPSQPHTTILLSSNQGINNTVNLSWNAYQGFTYSNFEIWRSANGAPMALLTTVANSTLAYVDNNPPAQAYYQIQVTNPNGCSPSRSAFDYSTVKSNIVNGGNPAAIPGLNETTFDFGLFPNPTAGLVHASIISTYTGTATLRVTDMLGRQIQKQDLQIGVGKNSASIYIPVAGTYFVELAPEGGVAIKKIITVQ